MITLRDDQEEVRIKLRHALSRYQSVLLYAPTGFGKTVLTSSIIKSITERGKTALFCVHRDALIKQTAETFRKFGVRHTYIASGYPYYPSVPVAIASIPTLKNRLGRYHFDYVFIDEAHLSASDGWSKTVDYFKGRRSRIIGMSGSPVRLDGKPLGDVWDVLVEGPSVRWLIDHGHLNRYRAFCPSTVDVSHIKQTGIDSSQMTDFLSQPSILRNFVDETIRYCDGLTTILFTNGRKQSDLSAESFRDRGITAVAVDGNTPIHERTRIFRDYAAGKIKILINCRLFTEGFDLAAQTGMPVVIQAVVDCAPTMSLPLHVQKHGRGLRADEDPHVLMDLVGGFARHGLPCDDREWSLTGKVINKREAALVICPSCFITHESPSPRPICPECGYQKIATEGQSRERSTSYVDDNVIEIDVEARRGKYTPDEKKQVIQENRSCRTYEDFVDLGRRRKYRSPEGWARQQILLREEWRCRTEREYLALAIARKIDDPEAWAADRWDKRKMKMRSVR